MYFGAKVVHYNKNLPYPLIPYCIYSFVVQFSAPSIVAILLWDFTDQPFTALAKGLFKPVLRLVVDLVALAEVAYADGDVGHVW